MEALAAALHDTSTSAASTFTCSGSFERPVDLSFRAKDGDYDPDGLTLPGRALILLSAGSHCSWRLSSLSCLCQQASCS